MGNKCPICGDDGIHPECRKWAAGWSAARIIDDFSSATFAGGDHFQKAVARVIRLETRRVRRRVIEEIIAHICLVGLDDDCVGELQRKAHCALEVDV